ncbi:hypothetical protein L7F22_024408, partial [Adiantum nelumboides]|nr:hypothetical protein [Adiantum nelumboides]
MALHDTLLNGVTPLVVVANQMLASSQAVKGQFSPIQPHLQGHPRANLVQTYGASPVPGGGIPHFLHASGAFHGVSFAEVTRAPQEKFSNPLFRPSLSKELEEGNVSKAYGNIGVGHGKSLNVGRDSDVGG